MTTEDDAERIPVVLPNGIAEISAELTAPPSFN